MKDKNDTDILISKAYEVRIKKGDLEVRFRDHLVMDCSNEDPSRLIFGTVTYCGPSKHIEVKKV